MSLLRSPGLETSGEASPRAWGAGQRKRRCKVTGVWPISTGLEGVRLVWPKPQSCRWSARSVGSGAMPGPLKAERLCHCVCVINRPTRVRGEAGRQR